MNNGTVMTKFKVGDNLYRNGEYYVLIGFVFVNSIMMLRVKRIVDSTDDIDSVYDIITPSGTKNFELRF